MATSHCILLILSLLSLLALSTSKSTTCKSQTFSDKKTTFENCDDLPTLNAVLHWTYDSSLSSLSMAFTAPPPSPEGWVAWALNPKAPAMAGAQALIAFKPKSGGPVSVESYDIQSYHALVKGPISYNVSSVSAEESVDGGITIFATWKVPSGLTTVNQVWQVGPVVNGKIGKHEFDKPNLESTMKLSLLGGPVGEPTMAPTGSPGPAPVAGVSGAVRMGFGVTSSLILATLVAFLF